MIAPTNRSIRTLCIQNLLLSYRRSVKNSTFLCTECSRVVLAQTRRDRNTIRAAMLQLALFVMRDAPG